MLEEEDKNTVSTQSAFLSEVREGLLDLITCRRSVRLYHKIKPASSLLDRVIHCAICAPSAHNSQPWRFYVIDNEAKKTKLIDEMASRFRADLESDHVPQFAIEKKIKRSVHLFSFAPVLIVGCIDMADMEIYPDSSRQQAEMIMATQSLAAAIQNLLLAAETMGLSGCWYCAPLFCPDIVKKVLSLADGHSPQALITLGYPAEKPEAPRRFGIDEIRFTL